MFLILKRKNHPIINYNVFNHSASAINISYSKGFIFLFNVASAINLLYMDRGLILSSNAFF